MKQTRKTWGSRALRVTESSKEAGLVRVYAVVEETELERNQETQYTVEDNTVILNICACVCMCTHLFPYLVYVHAFVPILVEARV